MDFPAPRSFVDAAESAVIRSGHAIRNMRRAGARPVPTPDFSLQMVDDSDIYVGIIGLRYGTPVPGQPDVSYTRLEFERATLLGMPRLIFLLNDEAALPLPARYLTDSKHGHLQDEFRARLRQPDLTSALVAWPAELELELFDALVTLSTADLV